jgi:hypothetical protein
MSTNFSLQPIFFQTSGDKCIENLIREDYIFFKKGAMPDFHINQYTQPFINKFIIIIISSMVALPNARVSLLLC